ncbi:MAG: sulfite exporter TauE/SafE family protein [Planctomycetota bacterium]|nr:sulfite exporter TauE/SafE family protein [Planctomycetota bacterium]
MGGGTVAFPILVLAYGLPATLGRDFSFAIQSIGMTSAAIFILCRRQQLAWATLGGSMAGSLIGLPLGILWVAPNIPTVWVKVLFAVFWAAFGVLHLARLDELLATTGNTGRNGRKDFLAGLLVGAAGRRPCRCSWCTTGGLRCWLYRSSAHTPVCCSPMRGAVCVGLLPRKGCVGLWGHRGCMLCRWLVRLRPRSPAHLGSAAKRDDQPSLPCQTHCTI